MIPNGYMSLRVAVLIPAKNEESYVCDALESVAAQTRLPDELWDRMQNFLESLSRLPCWIDKNLSTTVFGPKQNLDFWEKVFGTGTAPTGIQVLAQGLDLNQMIQSPIAGAGGQA